MASAIHMPLGQQLQLKSCQVRCPSVSIRPVLQHISSRCPIQQHTQWLQPCTVRTSSAEDPGSSMEELFAAELAHRQAAEAKQAEVAAAAVFDGPALLALLRYSF